MTASGTHRLLFKSVSGDADAKIENGALRLSVVHFATEKSKVGTEGFEPPSRTALMRFGRHETAVVIVHGATPCCHATNTMTDFDPTDTRREASEVTNIQKARHKFLRHKQETTKESTARSYKFPTKDFIQHCLQHGASVTGDITKRMVTTWLDERKQEVKPITVKNNAKHIRVFLKWMGSRELCDWDIHEKIEIPTVPDRGDVNEDVLRADLAQSTLDYLDTYEYATIYHTLLYTMWHTGCRISGAISLDVDDFVSLSSEADFIKFRNREQSGTPLKNNHKSKRDVTISDDLSLVLNDYINGRRLDKTDEYGRKPLFTIQGGRLTRQRAYKNIVAVTRPCVSTGNCPHDREIETCEAAQLKQQAPSCPSSASLHPIRKGAITNLINEGWPKEALSERVDVSVDVLEKHYDFRTTEKERKHRLQYMD